MLIDPAMVIEPENPGIDPEMERRAPLTGREMLEMIRRQDRDRET